jgi:hypothetical protein
MSNRYPIRVGARFSLVVATLVSLFIVRSLKPEGIGVAVLLSIWLLLPYAVLAVVLERRPSAATEIANVITTLLVVAGGLLFLIMVVFVNPDPQGGIAVMFTPIYQGIATAVLLPLTRWLFARHGGSEGDPGSAG